MHPAQQVLTSVMSTRCDDALCQLRGGGISIRDVGKLRELEYDTRELLVLNLLTLRSMFQPRDLALNIVSV